MKFLGITLILSIFVLLFVVAEHFLSKPHPVYHKCMWIIQDSGTINNIDPEAEYSTYQIKCPHGYKQNFYAPTNKYKIGQAIELELDMNLNQ
jgi:hypothetical protein